MPVHEGRYPNGTPNWVDLMVDDVPAAREFYGALFGWETFDGPPEAGGYTMALLQGRPVAGIAPKPEGVPVAAWSLYLAVDDGDATTARAREAGATITVEPMDVLDVGRFAFGIDPTGAHFGLWQGSNHLGSGLVGDPGSMAWHEAMSRDYATAKDFYAALFGWTYTEIGEGGFHYAVVRNGEQDNVAGVGQLPDQTPAEVPAHWMNSFAVEDVDASAQRVEELGGRIAMAPWDTPYGRMSVVQGAQGEMFALVKPVPVPDASRS
ncbi:MAG: VOC family protein [Oryzihumus sp.]